MARRIFRTTTRTLPIPEDQQLMLSNAAIPDPEPAAAAEPAEPARRTRKRPSASAMPVALEPVAPPAEPAPAEPAPVEPAAAEAAPAPVPAPKKRGRPRKAAAAPVAPEPVAPEPVAPEPVAPEPVAPEPVAPGAAGSAAIAPAGTLPALDAPAVNASQPAASYKPDFADRTQWYVSEDGGKTKAPAGTVGVCGHVVDFCLMISPSSHRDNDDYRLRIAFIEPTGRMAELNLNAVNYDSRSDNLYATSPARSLLGGLWAISQSDDDIITFCEGARFRLKPGTGRGLFVEVDAATNGRWVTMTSPGATKEIPSGVIGFLNTLEQVKARFREAGMLMTDRAIYGETQETQAVDTVAVAAD